jgi:pimeloyl-ACP methyl ester carboxylesterase
MKILNHIQVGTGTTTLLFLHGLNESLDSYQPVVNELESSLLMHAIDLRGHGNSPWRQPYDLSAYMDDVVEYIHEEIDGASILSGHSLGGLIATGIAATHPGLVQALILEDPPFYTAQLPVLRHSPMYELFTSVRGLLLHHHEHGGELEELLHLVREWRVEGPESPKLIEAFGENYVKQLALDLHRTDPSTLDPVLAGTVFDGFEPDALLTKISCPVLLIAGDSQRGGVLREQDIDRIGSLVEGIEIIRLSEIGHEIHATRPRWFAEVLRGFLVENKLLA